MKKRIEAILVCMFLLASSLVIVYPIKALKVNGNTLYVGGSGPGNYSTIQSAIDAANPGDTIFVYSGTYNEYLYLEKTINLIGENKDTTLINYNTKYHSLIILLDLHYIIQIQTL